MSRKAMGAKWFQLKRAIEIIQEVEQDAFDTKQELESRSNMSTVEPQFIVSSSLTQKRVRVNSRLEILEPPSKKSKKAVDTSSVQGAEIPKTIDKGKCHEIVDHPLVLPSQHQCLASSSIQNDSLYRPTVLMVDQPLDLLSNRLSIPSGSSDCPTLAEQYKSLFNTM